MCGPKYGHNFASGGWIWTNKDVFESSYNILFNSIHVIYRWWPFRDSDFRHNARYKVIALEMKSDPTRFQKQSLRET